MPYLHYNHIDQVVSVKFVETISRYDKVHPTKKAKKTHDYLVAPGGRYQDIRLF